jgi:hypothetical protein
VKSLRLADEQRAPFPWSRLTRTVPNLAHRGGRLRGRPRSYHRRFATPVCCAKTKNQAEILSARRAQPGGRRIIAPGIHPWGAVTRNDLSPARDERTPPPCSRNGIAERNEIARKKRGGGGTEPQGRSLFSSLFVLCGPILPVVWNSRERIPRPSLRQVQSLS